MVFFVLALFLSFSVLFFLLFANPQTIQQKTVKQTGQIEIIQPNEGSMLITELAKCSREDYALEQADFVVEGTVLTYEKKAKAIKETVEDKMYPFSVLLTLQIEKQVKGTLLDGNTALIKEPYSPPIEIEFKKGERLRVYFKKEQGVFSIFCGSFGIRQIRDSAQ